MTAPPLLARGFGTSVAGPLLASALAACAPAAGDPAPSFVPEEPGLTIAAVDEGFTVGALAWFDPATDTVHDTLSVLTGDPVVAAVDGRIAQLNRYRHDTLRLYTPGAWQAPDADVGLGEGANPHDAVACGDALIVSTYGRASLALRDPETGLDRGTVDLSDHADADGLPEASDLVTDGDTVWVGLQRLVRSDGWRPAADGKVLAIDCATWTITRTWDVGPNPRLVRARSGGPLWAVTGAPAPDVYRIDPESEAAPVGGWGPGDPPDTWSAAAALDGGRLVLVGYDLDRFEHTVACGTPGARDWQRTEGLSAYLSDVEATDEGAMVAVRPGWADPIEAAGLAEVDSETCTVATPRPMELPPFALAWVVP